MCVVLNKSEQILMLHSLKIIHTLIIIGHAGARCLKITVCITFKGTKQQCFHCTEVINYISITLSGI